MAWRIDAAVVRGEIDNRTPGVVTGRIWFMGLEEPVLLDLKGNCHRDLAGCHLSFVNPEPKHDHRLQDFTRLQEGRVGDMTAARKVRIPAVDEKDPNQPRDPGISPPPQMANCLYLEWFSQINGRVLIESLQFQCVISEHTWVLSPEAEAEQLQANESAMMEFLDQVAKVPNEDQFDDLDDETDSSLMGEALMDEFEAERFLQESDRRTERYMELLDKYHDHPDEDRIIAKAMGWPMISEEDQVEDDDEEDQGSLSPDLTEVDQPSRPVPPPHAGSTSEEIVDWITSDDEADGDFDDDEEAESEDAYQEFDSAGQDHPLCVQARDLSVRLMKESKANHYGYEEGPAHPVHRMVFGIMCCSGKLAGALNGLDEDQVPYEPGMTVAWLKRALNYLHDGMAGAHEALQQHAAPAAWIEGARREMFDVRAEILSLMEKYRKMIW